MENKEVRIARLEEKVLAMQEALILAREQLVGYKAQSNEWRMENLDIQNTRESVEAHNGDMKTLNIKIQALYDKMDAKFTAVKYFILGGIVVLAALIISLYQFMK